MTSLWIVVVLLLLATLLCLIPPLLRRALPVAPAADENLRAFYRAQREQLQRDLRAGSVSPEAALRAEEELQRELLQDLAARQPRVGLVGGQRAGLAAACLLTVLIPVAAVLLYGKLGNPRAVADMTHTRTAPAHANIAGNGVGNGASNGADNGAATDAAGPASDGADMAVAINALAQRLRASPDDADGWYTLARSYETLGRYTDAVAAYRQVLRLVPGQPVVLADLADALLSANQGKPDTDAIAAVAQALVADPDQPKALALAGMMALRRGDAAEALVHWERLQTLLPADSEAARQIQSNIAQARAMSAGAPDAKPGSGMGASISNTNGAADGVSSKDAPPPTGPSPARISGTASIADALRDQVQPGDTVFILARPVAGSRMPLAITQWRVSDLPRAFVLDDSNAMSPQAKLSGASRVQVEIRISRSGKAAAQPGDLSGVLSDVDIRARDLELVADTVVR
ncbi:MULTISPECIES: c-type cytochrome biogenesis protein CcmI [Achromobacter]|uniref:C-type cytochrome biogenesis protein CcmI n=1 Tax=Achromobacter spanius TaxID=217203 RepID=A0ABY8GUM9_9BURK|nr:MULTISPECIES: c-type cytochrome biogenesis protein CcmI [Achromobacter]WAI82183.1 c-type cytochrome biogenesis protein CcmI [Achromobacter spanius]WEX92273.1 c-type cytochrome biogenesis protein CcmI [Achromobacter sp. SS2-2022]WFP08579.1 c-type cytochrome biogenesis protein CcmI [Achromobacter spanius]